MFKNNTVFFFVACLLVLGGLVIFFLGQKESPEVSTPASNEKEASAVEAGVTKIVDEPPKSGSVVYENGKFFPKAVILQGGEGGCLVSVQNKSSEPLLVRLSPHDPADRQGMQYPEIPPGQSILIDPRFRIPTIAFHNHKNPAEEFLVDPGNACKIY